MTFMYAVTSPLVTDTAVIFVRSLSRTARERALRACVEDGGMPEDSRISPPLVVVARDIERHGLKYDEPYVNR